jgi:hypothetical protein
MRYTVKVLDEQGRETAASELDCKDAVAAVMEAARFSRKHPGSFTVRVCSGRRGIARFPVRSQEETARPRTSRR